MNDDPESIRPPNNNDRPLPAPLREGRTDTPVERATQLITAFEEHGKERRLDDMAEAVVKVLRNSDVVLLKEYNRSVEAARRHDLSVLRERRKADTEQHIARVEQYKVRLRFLGLYVAGSLSVANGAAAVVVLMYVGSLAFGLGLIALAAACAGAAFAIATGVEVKPQDFIDMLSAGRSLAGPDGDSDIEGSGDNGSNAKTS